MFSLFCFVCLKFVFVLDVVFLISLFFIIVIYFCCFFYSSCAVFLDFGFGNDVLVFLLCFVCWYYFVFILFFDV
jgi:hypothetical protein